MDRLIEVVENVLKMAVSEGRSIELEARKINSNLLKGQISESDTLTLSAYISTQEKYDGWTLADEEPEDE